MINSSIKNKISRFNLELKEGPQTCPVFLKLPWIGKISLKFESQIKSVVQKCYGAVEPRVIFSTRKLLLAKYTKERCPPPIKVWSYINTCAGVTADTWAAHLKDCRIELHNTSETHSYPREICQHATAKQKSQQSTAVFLQLDFIYFKMINARNFTTINNFQLLLKHELHFTLPP